MKPRQSFPLLLLFLFGCHLTPIGSGVKITYEVGWWVYQDRLVITSADIEKDPKGLGPSMLYNKADAIVSIAGQTTGKPGWRPVVETLHISQVKSDSSAAAKITITPIVELKQNSSYSGEILPFTITKRISIPAMNFGANTYHFQIGAFQKDLIYHRR